MARRVFLPMFDRRTVLRGMAATLVGALAACRITLDDPEVIGEPADDIGPDAGAGSTPDALELDLADPTNAALLEVDGARLVTANGKRLLVIRTDASTFVALSSVCTHSGCTVDYAPARSDVVCPCHGSTFSLDGRVTHGPAARPLAAFDAMFDAAANRVTIRLG